MDSLGALRGAVMTTSVYTKEQQKAIAGFVEKRRLEACTISPYPPKTADTLKWALFIKMQMDLRLNTRSQQAEWRTGQEVPDEDSWDNKWEWNDWQPLTQGAKAHLRDEMQKRHEVKFSREALEDALDVVLFDLHVDPLKEYLEGLPTPQGRNILPKMLSTCMNVRDKYKELAEWASVYMFLGVVWRTFKPGTKLDEIPILVGPGAIGKSTFPAMAVPQHIPGLYTSGLELNANAKTKVEALQGKALLEISEMVGAQASEMGKIKDYISRTDDGAIRLSFRRDPEPMPSRLLKNYWGRSTSSWGQRQA